MTTKFLQILTVATGALLLSAASDSSKKGSGEAPAVKVVRIPGGGIQPQVATDEKGVVHLVYFAGDPTHGDLLYVRSSDAGTTFSAPIRVNSQEGSAIAAGNIRGARIAVGRTGRVHVAWNGSGSAEPRTADGKAPMLYARLDGAGKAFEPQRSLIHTASGIDGGGALAADHDGNVFVFWHAGLPGSKDEASRRVWIARSSDDGKTFSDEKLAFDKPTGVCGCCGMSAFADSQGGVYALFRSAFEMVNRDMYLLTSNDHGQSFCGTNISKWNVGACVMSSEAFAESASGALAAWETEKQILYTRIDRKTGKAATLMSAPGSGVNRKYPALAVNRDGFALLGWTEGMGWKKGGTSHWQVLDPEAKAVGQPGMAEGVPVWGLVAAFAASDGSFRVMY
jgi:hypothetical protein